MSQHDCPPVLGVPKSGTLDDQDVFHVSGLTESVDESGGTVSAVNVALNEDELLHAYEASCARSMTDFETFKQEVNTSANEGALVAYAPARDLNNLWTDSPNAQRILRIRICIKWRWLRIYIYWKI